MSPEALDRGPKRNWKIWQSESPSFLLHTAAHEPGQTTSLSWPLLGFFVVYILIASGLYLAALGNTTLLPLSMLLITAQLVALILGGAFASHSVHRRFYTAASTLSTFTLIRLALSETLGHLPEALVSYLILGATLVSYEHATQARIQAIGLKARDLVSNLRFAIPFGLALAFFELSFSSASPSYVSKHILPTILVAGSVALLDEYWFRGILQSQIEAVSTRAVGWLGTVVLFVALAAPTGDLMILSFRAGLGLFLGFLVWRRRLLPLALTIRTTSSVLVIVLVHLGLGGVPPS